MSELKVVRQVHDPFDDKSIESATEHVLAWIRGCEPVDPLHLVMAMTQASCQFATQFAEDLPKVRAQAIRMWNDPVYFRHREQSALSLETNLEALEYFLLGMELALYRQEAKDSKPVVDRLIQKLHTVMGEFLHFRGLAHERGLLQGEVRGLFMDWGGKLVELQGLHDETAKPS